MRYYTIVETDTQGEPLEEDGHRFYLNHAHLGSMSFGSRDMAWSTDNELAAEGMAARVAAHRNARPCAVVEL